MKKFLILSFAVLCVSSSVFAVSAFAETKQNNPVFESQNNNDGIMPYSEDTGYKYKYINGVKYKRLWSYTYERWIDPKWTKA